MSASIFSPDGKNFWEFMTPNFPKPMFLAHFHLEMVGIFFFYAIMAPGPGQWPWDRPNFGRPPGTGLSLAQGQGFALAWARGTFFLGRGWPTPSPEKNHWVFFA